MSVNMNHFEICGICHAAVCSKPGEPGHADSFGARLARDWKVIGEPIRNVDATPDDEYVLRVLQAHLYNNESCTITDNLDGDPPTNPLFVMMNEANAERARLLRRAIARLSMSESFITCEERVSEEALREEGESKHKKKSGIVIDRAAAQIAIGAITTAMGSMKKHAKTRRKYAGARRRIDEALETFLKMKG